MLASIEALLVTPSSMLTLGLGGELLGELGAPRLVNPMAASQTGCMLALCEDGAGLLSEAGAWMAMVSVVEDMS